MPKIDKQQFVDKIHEFTEPINNQYPRPWMTKLRDPLQAEVFVVGMNQSWEYSTDDISHEQHVEALFNQGPDGCRGMYDMLTDGNPSHTRKNIDCLVERLAHAGVDKVLETNVICYSTGMSKYLRENPHIGGAKRGKEIFRFLLCSIEPRVLIVHGKKATEHLESVLDCDLPAPPECADDGPTCCWCGEQLVIVIRSLAPPEYNEWSKWASTHFLQVSDAVARHLNG